MTARTRAVMVTVTVAVAVAAVGVLAGCATEPDPGGARTTAMVATAPPAGQNAPTPAPPAPASLTTPTRPTAKPTPSAALSPTPTVTRSLPRNQISIDGQQVARTTAAAAAATRFMQAFARPDLSKGAWWARVSPLLTASAQQNMFGTDPARVPVTKLTGPSVALPNAEKDARIVTVPTDIGDYTLFLLWDRPTSRWLVQTAQPPDGVK